jgi:hypothetical protein
MKKRGCRFNFLLLRKLLFYSLFILKKGGFILLVVAVAFGLRKTVKFGPFLIPKGTLVK